jgi:hypothetical protein
LITDKSVLDTRTQKVTTESLSLTQRAAKKAKISEEMSLVADKYSENDPVPCSIDDRSVTEFRDDLEKMATTQNLGICFFCTENSNIR